MPTYGRLRIHGQGGVDIQLVTSYLSDLKLAYDSLLAFETIMDDLGSREHRPRGFVLFDDSFRLLPFRSGGNWLPSSNEVANFVPSSERLILSSVRLESPGFWEFIGSLNPLEVIRKSLNDRHERRKDRQYKEAAERRRLTLENALLETKVLSQRIRIAKNLGATDRDLAPLLNQLVFQPLRTVGRHQSEGLIDNAEIVEQPDNEQE
jgi:hypothetical protein